MKRPRTSDLGRSCSRRFGRCCLQAPAGRAAHSGHVPLVDNTWQACSICSCTTLCVGATQDRDRAAVSAQPWCTWAAASLDRCCVHTLEVWARSVLLRAMFGSTAFDSITRCALPFRSSSHVRDGEALEKRVLSFQQGRGYEPGERWNACGRARTISVHPCTALHSPKHSG